jgi:hypothetical protein
MMPEALELKAVLVEAFADLVHAQVELTASKRMATVLKSDEV